MKKSMIVVLMVALALAAGLAFAAAVKLNLYATSDGAGASGQAILNYVKGSDKTEVQINCWGLIPGKTYVVWIGTNPTWSSNDKYGSFTALRNGAGNFHVSLDGDKSKLDVAIDNENSTRDILISWK